VYKSHAVIREGSEPSNARVLPFDFGLLLLVSFLLGFANEIAHGCYSEPALVIIFATLILLGWRSIASPRTARLPTPTLALGLVLVLLLSMPITALFDPKVIAHAPRVPVALRVIEFAEIALLLSYVPFLTGRRREPSRMRAMRFTLFALLMLVGGLVTFHASASPAIDVWTIQMRGAEALLGGTNPYASVTVPDTDPENTMDIPYVYPPTALYFTTLGLLLGKDVRYAMWAAVLVAGISMRYITRYPRSSRPALAEDAPSLFFWLTPILSLVLERSWIDPLQVMLISLGMAAYAGKRPTLSAIAFGAAVSSKQSMFWLIPLVGLMLRLRLREWLIMSLTAAALVFPFVVLDFGRLKYANFDFISGLPPRSDALAIAPWFRRVFHRTFPGVVGFLLAACTVAFALLRMRLSLAGFAQAATLTYLVFFLFNKWAFANYYFLVTGLAALAACAALYPEAPPDASPRLLERLWRRRSSSRPAQ
jgi:hypothetical protein